MSTAIAPQPAHAREIEIQYEEVAVSSNLTRKDTLNKEVESPETVPPLSPSSSPFPSPSNSSSSPSYSITALPPSHLLSSTLSPSSSVISPLTDTAQDLSGDDIERLVIQKQHQMAYIQKQQHLQQEQQRQLFFHNHRGNCLKPLVQRQWSRRSQQYEGLEARDALDNHSGAIPKQDCGQSISKKYGHGRNHELDYKHEQNTRAIGDTSTSNYSSRGPSSFDLVDDVWRMVFYVLAGDCKDLGRLMVVNKRFYSLIANDAVLWKLTYKLTVSGSIFANQKLLLSPTWFREEYYSYWRQQEVEDTDQYRSENKILDSGTRGSLPMTPGLQLPSPLVLPHHRKIIQTITTTASAFINSGAASTASYPDALDAQTCSIPGSSSVSSSSYRCQEMVASSVQTPASITALPSAPPFQPNLLPSVSQAISPSSIPLSAIQHHIPSTTLMHHSPAVYWKHQVVDWLEQEKLRCLRLGLFWGFKTATLRAHRGKDVLRY
ncbi:hypothetical protein BX616_002010 [Lobosporangium transversale]|uniref:F-box domain-containing protein n=1 Tax=Lobosporangium transversale TaxID=64571 RepID=A0A1Y2H0X0_9FUNG|nr:hypothetical protein BCR41DRAFT_391642 [Lobosporangium transversale]KAF9917072.1 hypothetical protein BX616_002010 [Lobosporangium transversale]ORZ28175.1 hypothetical protein BCR41DRAFT_391642 [Lobosporangium transversale]|eukprot:XP_021885860.1 hypothetical protein BCR41DRAFT_391642 [Lobosporangium transversale]